MIYRNLLLAKKLNCGSTVLDVLVEVGGNSGPGPTPDKVTIEEVVVVMDGKLIEDSCMLLVLGCG